jgi:photosystem II stability/assembly factor-like uncharacterized protein
MLRSTDDGSSWHVVPASTSNSMYAVRFASPLIGMAVGLHGTAVMTADGGITWQPRAAGIDRMLGDIAWLDPSHAIVVGEAGTVLRMGP